MGEMILSTLKTVVMLFIYIAIGFLLGKKKIVGEGASKTLAAVLTYVVMPIYGIQSLSKNVSFDKIALYGEVFISGLVITAVCICICIPLSGLFVKNGYSRNVYKYLLYSPNLGYFGYPVVEAVFGGEMLATYMIFTMPISIGISTFGYMILTDRRDEILSANIEMKTADLNKSYRKDFIKRLFSVPMLGTFVGLIIGFTPITLPEICYEYFEPASACMRALAMMLTGIVLSAIPFKSLFTNKKAYIVGVLRLLVYPLVFGGIAYVLYKMGLSRELFILTVCLMALPAGMNVVVYPESIGKSGKEGAQACFISYVLVLVTLPLVFLIMQSLI